VTSWEIHVPYPARSDSLIDVASGARVLEGEDQKVAHEVAIRAMVDDGLRTAGELIDRLEAAGPGERRAILERARTSADLAAVGEVDEDRRYEAANRAARAVTRSPYRSDRPRPGVGQGP
jgi:hypothetical protein